MASSSHFIGRRSRLRTNAGAARIALCTLLMVTLLAGRSNAGLLTGGSISGGTASGLVSGAVTAVVTTTVQGVRFATGLFATVKGRVICDVCRNANFDDGMDSSMENVLVEVSCEVVTACLLGICPPKTTVTVSALTDPFGYFQVVGVPTVNATLRGGNSAFLGCRVKLGSSKNSSCATLEEGLCGLEADLKTGVTGGVSLRAGATVTLSPLCFTGAGKVPEQCVPGVKGDPHFTGGYGAHFDFTGLPGKTYCMLSDAHLHVNMFYNGRFGQWGSNPHKPMTWIRQLAILWGHHTILLEARTGASWRYETGYMARMTVDGEIADVAAPGSSASFHNGKIAIAWLEARSVGSAPMDAYEVRIPSVLHMRVRLQPEVAHLRSAEDAAVHMNVELERAVLSSHVHGVLGQTFRADHSTRISQQALVRNEHLGWDMVPGDNAEGFLDGEVGDYENPTGLLSASCRFARFARAETLDGETAEAIEMNGDEVRGDSVPHPSSVTTSRKMLSWRQQ